MRKEFIILGCGNSTGNPKIDGTWGKCKKGNKKNFRTRCSAMIIKGKNFLYKKLTKNIYFIANKT